MLRSRVIPVVFIFAMFIIASLFFSVYGVSAKSDEGILLKTNKTLIYYLPRNVGSLSVLSGGNETVVLLPNSEAYIIGLNGKNACYRYGSLVISGIYRNQPSIVKVSATATYEVYTFKGLNASTALYCGKNVVAAGNSHGFPYIINISKNGVTSSSIMVYISYSPTSINKYNGSYVLTFGNNIVIFINNGKEAIVASLPAKYKIYSSFVNDGSLYLVGSTTYNYSNYGVVINYNKNESYILVLGGKPGFIGIGTGKLNGYCVYYRPNLGFGYYVVITENKHVHTSLVGLSYPFSLAREGTFMGGIWFTGNFSIDNASYAGGIYVNSTMSGNIGSKNAIGWIISGIPIVSKARIVEMKLHYNTTTASIIPNSAYVGKGHGHLIKTNAIKTSYLTFQVNRYVTFGEFAFIAILIGLAIYIPLARNYGWI
ncbi:MAG: hypothetical protein F7B61_05515 [Caldisphaeraceae archaeon]|nr:hypothetical protein [Caldisphaeraceae archaeon]